MAEIIATTRVGSPKTYRAGDRGDEGYGAMEENINEGTHKQVTGQGRLRVQQEVLSTVNRRCIGGTGLDKTRWMSSATISGCSAGEIRFLGEKTRRERGNMSCTQDSTEESSNDDLELGRSCQSDHCR